MKILKIIGLCFLVLAVTLGVLIWLNSRPLSKDQADLDIKRIIDNSLDEKKSVYSALVFVDSPERDLAVKYAAGKSNGESIKTDQPFHVASVGKLFTATLIGRLVDEGKIKFDDPIYLYLDNDLLENLFIYEGVDYKKQVTVQQLLSHTSGVADCVAVEDGGLLESIIQSPDTFYTPQTLVQYSQDHQSAYFAPGDGYHYSDTGYILLGLIIEAVTGKPFYENLHEVIFEPLEMNDTYLMFYSDPVNTKRPIAEIWVNGHEISKNKSLSIDWAGGGVISTLDDLATFIRALYQNRIVSSESLKMLNQFENEFIPGIAYGNGVMQMQFEKFFPTLGSLPRMNGHMGILGTQLFYDPTSDLVYVSSFGSTEATDLSVRTMIQILSTVYRIQLPEI